MNKPAQITITLTEAQVQVLGRVLDYAYDDRAADTSDDYTPEDLTELAATYREVGAVSALLGIAGEQQRWNALATETEPAAPDIGNACPKCGGHSFELKATFSGTVDVTFDGGSDNEFYVDDSEPGDSEWDGPATCRNCGWDGTLSDLVSAPEKEGEA